MLYRAFGAASAIKLAWMAESRQTKTKSTWASSSFSSRSWLSKNKAELELENCLLNTYYKMNKKAYISPETMVISVKIDRLMNAGSPTDPQAHDEEGSPDQFSRRRRRNKWEDEEEDEEEW